MSTPASPGWALKKAEMACVKIEYMTYEGWRLVVNDVARALQETRSKALEEAAQLVKQGTIDDCAQYPGSLGLEPEGYYSWRFVDEIRALKTKNPEAEERG